jgi:hypothetical protein
MVYIEGSYHGQVGKGCAREVNECETSVADRWLRKFTRRCLEVGR